MAKTSGGSIINISSIGALRAIGFAAYSAAKGGMISLTQEMAGDHGHQGIRVNVVVPGSIMTPRAGHAAEKLGADFEQVKKTAASVIPLGQTTEGTGWDIGYATLFFASEESSWITGQVLTVDGGVSITAAPALLGRVLRQQQGAS